MAVRIASDWVGVQVYKGVLRSDGRVVAVKIQRPGLVQEVTKDLYVLKRAVGVYQNLSDRRVGLSHFFWGVFRVGSGGGGLIVS